MSDRDDEFREKLKGLGLEKVEHLRTKGVYGERKLRIVKEWITSQERERSESFREEDLGIKRYAASRQNIAAIAAIIAALMTIIGVIVSIITLDLSVF